MARAVAHRPWKLAILATMGYAAQTVTSALLSQGGEDDETQEKRERIERLSLREEEQGYTWFGLPRMLRLPVNDEHGNPLFLDIRRWIPVGDTFDLNQGQSVLPLPAWAQVGGPLMMGFEYLLNKTAFMGREIANEKVDGFWERAGKTGDWLWKGMMPNAPWVPGSYSNERLSDAARGAQDRRRGAAYSVPQAVASSVGIKVIPHNVEAGLMRHIQEHRRVHGGLAMEANIQQGMLRDRMIPQESFNGEMARLIKKAKQNEDGMKPYTDALSEWRNMNGAGRRR